MRSVGFESSRTAIAGFACLIPTMVDIGIGVVLGRTVDLCCIELTPILTNGGKVRIGIRQ